MECVEFTRRYAGSPERVQGLQRLAVENPDACRAPAGDVQEALPRVRREGHAGGCVAVIAPASNCQAPAVDPYLGYVFAIGREHLHPLAAAVGDIHEPVIRDFDAVHGWYKLRRPRVFGIKPRGQSTLGFLLNSCIDRLSRHDLSGLGHCPLKLRTFGSILRAIYRKATGWH